MLKDFKGVPKKLDQDNIPWNMGYNKAINDCVEFLKGVEVSEEMIEALEFSKKRRVFEGTPKMCFNQACDALDSIARVSRLALKTNILKKNR